MRHWIAASCFETLSIAEPDNCSILTPGRPPGSALSLSRKTTQASVRKKFENREKQIVTSVCLLVVHFPPNILNDLESCKREARSVCRWRGTDFKATVATEKGIVPF
ncbi:hypothetical protein AVEN_234671-1 [Araneus ventricosus]|uniref:Uncharacterized protein n=1 Tax=Araneus ventricosus TaxID=182803 RepID=A0A4Y2CZK9_ARAVE|nr:hypothetical protein AVEN_234671-1 [Araneus ventricosus]